MRLSAFTWQPHGVASTFYGETSMITQTQVERADALDELRKHDRECGKRYGRIWLWLVILTIVSILIRI